MDVVRQLAVEACEERTRRGPTAQGEPAMAGLRASCRNSEPSNRFAAGPSIDATWQRPAETGADSVTAGLLERLGFRVEAARQVTQWYVRSHLRRDDAAAATGWELYTARHLRAVPLTHEKDVSTIGGALWRRTPTSGLSLEVRRRHVFAPANSRHAGAAPVRGWRADLSALSFGSFVGSGGGCEHERRHVAAEWDAAATVRGGTLGRGTCGAVFARATVTHEREVRLPRGRTALARVRAYGYAMPIHSGQMPAVDAPQHPAGMARGADAYVVPPGGAAVAAVSAELDCALVPRKATLRLYASGAAALPSWRLAC